MGLLERFLGKRPPGLATDLRADGGTSTGRTFAVSQVTPATEPLPVIPYPQAATEFLGGQVESCSQYHGQLVAGVRFHPLIEALHRAFATHRSISLSPDVIWLTLTQGLAYHINANAEQLRHHFVRHEGKLKIVVRRDDFVKGSPENPWPEVFTEFSIAIREHIGDAHDLIVADFSTTGPVERAASEVVLLDAMQAYFTYEEATECGIPSITLEGTVADWQAIANRAKEFGRFGLGWWVDVLRPILDQFVAAANGMIDRTFWDSIYKWEGRDESGESPYVSGWVLKLFPYLSPVTDDLDDAGEGFPGETEPAQSFCCNPWMTRPPSRGNGPAQDRFPQLPARAPFLWKYYPHQKDYEMEFIGGLMGVRQDPQTLCLRPEIGWAVWEVGAERRKIKADAEAAAQARAAEERARAVERAKTEVVAPRLDPNKPRHSQFFQFICPFCNHREEIGLWYTYRTCSECKKGWRIVRPADAAR
jgi:hypothetical protein